MTTPLILVDVDGVLNVIGSARERKRLVYHEGWRSRKVDLPPGQFRLTVHPEHGPQLLKLAAETGGELAWGTTWEDYANRYVGPLIGLPHLPVAPLPFSGHKARGFVPWTAGRPFVWFDDEPDAAAVTAELAGDQPHLVIQVDEHAGLTPAHIATAREWLLALPGSREGKAP
jgi:hypothetical protein